MSENEILVSDLLARVDQRSFDIARYVNPNAVLNPGPSTRIPEYLAAQWLRASKGLLVAGVNPAANCVE